LLNKQKNYVMTNEQKDAIDFAWIKLSAYLEAKEMLGIEPTHWDNLVKDACDYLYPHSFRAEFDQRLQRAKEAKQ
jgi:hypothetical protein